MIGCKNIKEVEEVTLRLHGKVREWIKLNRKDLDHTLPIEDLLEKEVCLFVKFNPFDADEKTGEFCLELENYAICNKSFANRLELQVTQNESKNGNFENVQNILKFKKLED